MIEKVSESEICIGRNQNTGMMPPYSVFEGHTVVNGDANGTDGISQGYRIAEFWVGISWCSRRHATENTPAITAPGHRVQSC